jgi:hypothetical protein
VHWKGGLFYSINFKAWAFIFGLIWLVSFALAWRITMVPPKDDASANDNAYDLTPNGSKAFEALGIDIEATRTLRRRFACACLDWSERRPHVGGALGAALLKIVLKRKWVIQDLDSRVLDVTSIGRREMLTRFGLHV